PCAKSWPGPRPPGVTTRTSGPARPTTPAEAAPPLPPPFPARHLRRAHVVVPVGIILLGRLAWWPSSQAPTAWPSPPLVLTNVYPTTGGFSSMSWDSGEAVLGERVLPSQASNHRVGLEADERRLVVEGLGRVGVDGVGMRGLTGAIGVRRQVTGRLPQRTGGDERRAGECGAPDHSPGRSRRRLGRQAGAQEAEDLRETHAAQGEHEGRARVVG